MLPWRMLTAWYGARILGAIVVGLLFYGGAVTEHEWLYLAAGVCVLALIGWEVQRIRRR